MYNITLNGTLLARQYNASTGKWSSWVLNSRSAHATDNKPDNPSRVKKPSGWLYPKPYSRMVTSVRFPKGTWRSVDKNGNILEYTGQIGSYHTGLDLPSTSTRSDLRVRAEIDALTWLKAQRVNYSVAMAEVQQTANLFGDTCHRLSSITKSFRKGRAWRDIRRHLKSGGLSNDWLQYIYGVRPLISDVNGAFQDLYNREELRPTVTVKGMAVDQVDVQRWQSKEKNSFPLLITDRGFVGCFVRLDYECHNNLLAAASKNGLTNPFETAWELLPYSFVLDWALPVGDLLHTMDAALGFTFKSGSHSTIHRINSTGVGDIRNYHSGTAWPSPLLSYTGRAKVVRLDRGVYTSSPVPRRLVPKNPLSLTRVASGLSLLVQAFK